MILALDPSISLQLNQPQPMDMIGMFNGAAQGSNLLAQNKVLQAEVPNVQAQTANLQAENPGLQAQSQQQQVTAWQMARQQLAKQQFGAHGQEFIDPKTGMLDTPKVAAWANASGYGDMLGDLTTNFANGVKSELSNATDMQNLHGLQTTAINGLGSLIAQGASQLPSNQQSAYYQTERAKYAQLFPGLVNEETFPTFGADSTQNFNDWMKAKLWQPHTVIDKGNLANATKNAETGRIQANTAVASQNQSAAAAAANTVPAFSQSVANYGMAIQSGRSIDSSQLPGIFGYAELQARAALGDQGASTFKQGVDQYNAAHPGAPIDLKRGIPAAISTMQQDMDQHAATANNILKGAIAGTMNNGQPGQTAPPAMSTPIQSGQSGQQGQTWPNMNGTQTPIRNQNNQAPGNYKSKGDKMLMKSPDGKMGYVNSSDIQKAINEGWIGVKQ